MIALKSAAPLLSVVIPTYKRPHFLPRAIDSALEAAPDGDVEVIVVPNGGDRSWNAVAELYKEDFRVRWGPLEQANGNAARNHGLALAKGEYIRFLDDDDFLYDAAKDQLKELIISNKDLSVGQIIITNKAGDYIKEADQLDSDDFVEAALWPSHATQPSALLFRRSITENHTWDPSILKNQDMYWAWSLCENTNLTSTRFRRPVGAWVQHDDGYRVSEGHDLSNISMETATHILKLTSTLQAKGQLSPKRSAAASHHLWACIHRGMMFNPMHWCKISRQARFLDKQMNPGTPIYNIRAAKLLNPVLIELAIIPFRWLNYAIAKISRNNGRSATKY